MQGIRKALTIVGAAAMALMLGIAAFAFSAAVEPALLTNPGRSWSALRELLTLNPLVSARSSRTCTRRARRRRQRLRLIRHRECRGHEQRHRSDDRVLAG